MPKKKQSETQKEQSARFRAEVERMVAAGELSHTDAEDRVDALLASQRRARPEAN